MPRSHRRGLRSTQTERLERDDRAGDIELVKRLESCGLEFDWERAILEEATRRVYSQGRALLPRIKAEVEEIIARREGAARVLPRIKAEVEEIIARREGAARVQHGDE